VTKTRYALRAVAAVLLAPLPVTSAWAIAMIAAPPPMLEPLPFEVAVARKGDVSLQMRLGDWHSSDSADQKDPRKAAYWYLKAAISGNVDAQRYVIEDYELGNGFVRSHEKAITWYQRAALGGNYGAAVSLVGIYEREANTRMAVEWMRIGARSGDPWCQFRLADAYHSGKSPFPMDFSRAMTWYLRVADRHPGYHSWVFGGPMVEYAIGEMYARAEGVTQSYEKALRWYVLAASAKYVDPNQRDSEEALGELYAKGLGTPQDYRVASAWYQRAADHGLAEAGLKVAELYERGLGVPQSDRLAMYSYFKVITRDNWAADSESMQHQTRERLFAIFERGTPVPQDDAAAIQWYRENASMGDLFARRGLALSYEVGYRVPRNEGVAAGIESELERSDESPAADLLREWIPKSPPYRRRDFTNLLTHIQEPGQFLSAIDDFAAHAQFLAPAIND
jgi:TPR repeat protein